MSGERERVLGAVRAALAGRDRPAHPGPFLGSRPPRAEDPAGHGSDPVVDAFAARFTAAGGEVVRLADDDAAAAWVVGFGAGLDGATVGESVPPHLRPPLPAAPAEGAALGVSMASAAVAETGTVILDARDARRVQLLPPAHLVFVRRGDVHATLAGALGTLRGDLPSALGLHSGPSRSADIGQIVVRGVHGPGRTIVAILG